MSNFFKKALFFLFVLCFWSYAVAGETAFSSQDWQAWVKDLKKEAVSQGIKPKLFDQVFADLTPNPSLIKLDRHQPEFRLTFKQYLDGHVTPAQIRMGQKGFLKYKMLFTKIGKRYQIDPCVLVALWGMESHYGHYRGKFNTLRSLATLAFDTRRSDYFRTELLYALHILNGDHVSLADFKGAWDGGMGHPQFMPSTWVKFAQDYNEDGRKDIWNSLGDAIASMAFYLHQMGWQENEPISVEVILPKHFDLKWISKDIKKPIKTWRNMGVLLKPTKQPVNEKALVYLKQFHPGPTFMIFKNFDVLYEWNNSSYFVEAVNLLSQKICKPNIKQKKS